MHYKKVEKFFIFLGRSRPLRPLAHISYIRFLLPQNPKAFGQRRKMIRQSLKSVQGIEKACQDTGIDLTMRAEEITPMQYYKMDLLYKSSYSNFDNKTPR